VGAGNTYKPHTRVQKDTRPVEPPVAQQPQQQQGPTAWTQAINQPPTPPQITAAPTPEQRFAPRGNSGNIVGYGNMATRSYGAAPIQHMIGGISPVASTTMATNHQTPLFVNTDGQGSVQLGVNTGWGSRSVTGSINNGLSASISENWNNGIGGSVGAGFDSRGNLYGEVLGSQRVASSPYLSTSASSGWRVSANPMVVPVAAYAAAKAPAVVKPGAIRAATAAGAKWLDHLMRQQQPGF